MVAASGFQSGALEYAKTNKIACVRLVDGAWTYETRDLAPSDPQPTGHYVAYARQLTAGGADRTTMLSGQPDYARELLLNPGHSPGMIGSGVVFGVGA